MSTFPPLEDLVAPDLVCELARKHGTLIARNIDGMVDCDVYSYEGVFYFLDSQEVAEMDQNKYTREEKEANWGDELERAEKYPEGECHTGVDCGPYGHNPVDGDSRLEFAEEVETADYGQLWFTNSGGHDFQVHDLSVELTRKYLYPDGEIIIDNPATLFIAASGSHRVLGEDGWVTWLPAGFKAIQWLPRDGDNPVGF